MSMALKCDLCGKLFTPEELKGEYMHTGSIYVINAGNKFSSLKWNSKMDEADLCDTCTAQIKSIKEGMEARRAVGKMVGEILSNVFRSDGEENSQEKQAP